MHAKLVEILEEKKKEVTHLKKDGHPFPEDLSSGDTRNFKKAITSNNGIALIAEIKFVREKKEKKGSHLFYLTPYSKEDK